MRVWRAVKALGCGVLRDGVYLLPYRDSFRQVLSIQAEEIIKAGGNAYLLPLNCDNQDQQKAFENMFDRSADYAKLTDEIRSLSITGHPSADVTAADKAGRRLRKEFEAIVVQDYFPGAAQEQAAAALEDWEQAMQERLSPGEPHTVQRKIKRRSINDYQARLWATRKRPWIDRLASAWLIRRFIDTQARFIWLTDPASCPAGALGFDYDGGEFTHTGGKVTFETLQAGFALGDDAALNRIGAIVHYLDVGGIPVPEAAGLETLIRGMQQRYSDDDTLLFETEKIFDAYYQAFTGTDL